MNIYEHEKNIKNWLAKVGISPKFLADTSIDTIFLLAQHEATRCLADYFRYLEPDEVQTCIKYLKKLSSKKSREKMHVKAAHAVLNLSSKVNRRVYVFRKKFIKKHQSHK